MKSQIKIYKTLIIFMLLSINLYSQDSDLLLNQEFLNSLPEETRDELIKQLEDDQEKLSEVDFGVYSTMWSKSAAEKYIDQELLRSEDIIAPEDMTLDDLEIFGKNFFTGYPSSFMPVSEPSLSYEYVIDIGDTLDIEIFGSFNSSEKNQVISTDGSIVIKGIGAIQVAGLTLGDASKKISDVVSFKYPGAETNIKLNTLRTMQVILVGFVKVPGIYTLPGNSSVLSALRLAGGISDQGSFSNIEIKRLGEVIGNFDLYDLLINGNNQFNQALRPGDSVVVRAAGKRVSIYGGVSKPAIYEILDENINEIINFAGGPLNGNEINNITISSLADSSRITKNIYQSDFTSTPITNNSYIYVPYERESKSDSVELIGSFISPGLYALNNVPNFSQKNLLSSNAYTNALVLLKAKKTSNTYNYSLHSPSNKLSLAPGDKLIALSKDDIRFLNSNLLRNFFKKSENKDKYECNLFNHIENIRSTNRFERIEEFFLKTLSTGDIDEGGSSNSNLNLSEINVIEDQPISNQLFLNNENKSNEISCPKVFEKDPELLLSIIQNSVYIDGPTIQGGLYPIFEGINLLTLINSISFLTLVNLDDLVSISEFDDLSSIPIREAANYKVNLGSNITISASQTVDVNRIRISGEVNKPGYYYISRNERLSDLLSKAGSYTDNAYPIGGILLRESAKILKEIITTDYMIKSLRIFPLKS